MKDAMLNANRRFSPGCFQSGANIARTIRSHIKVSLTAVALVTALVVSSAAKADSYNFSVNGSGIQASGVIQVSDTGPLGAYTVTGISGLFSDSTNSILGTITGLKYAPPPVLNVTPPNTFGAPAVTDAGFTYDNLFWPDGDSPSVCFEAPVFFGGDFDVYGMAFDISGGYTADLWSDGSLGGYQLNDSLKGVAFSPNNLDGLDLLPENSTR